MRPPPVCVLLLTGGREWFVINLRGLTLLVRKVIDESVQRVCLR